MKILHLNMKHVVLRGLTLCIYSRSHHFPFTHFVRIDWFWKHLELIEITAASQTLSLFLLFLVSWQLQSNRTAKICCCEGNAKLYTFCKVQCANAWAGWQKQLDDANGCIRLRSLLTNTNLLCFQHTVMIPYKCKLNATHKHTESHPHTFGCYHSTLQIYFIFIFSFFLLDVIVSAQAQQHIVCCLNGTIYADMQ